MQDGWARPACGYMSMYANDQHYGHCGCTTVGRHISTRRARPPIYLLTIPHMYTCVNCAAHMLFRNRAGKKPVIKHFDAPVKKRTEPQSARRGASSSRAKGRKPGPAPTRPPTARQTCRRCEDCSVIKHQAVTTAGTTMRYHVRQARQFSSRLWPGLMVTSASMTTCGRTGDSPFWAHFRDQTNPL